MSADIEMNTKDIVDAAYAANCYARFKRRFHETINPKTQIEVL